MRELVKIGVALCATAAILYVLDADDGLGWGILAMCILFGDNFIDS